MADAQAVASIDAGARKLFITGAGRCGECHEKMYDEWETSAHASAASSPLYKAAKTDSKDATCDRCHAPLREPAPRDEVATEGVTCDVCHTLREPTPTKDGGSFKLAIDDMVKYGPRCDLKDHYFHRMGCSKEHQEATFCGSCHWWEPKGIPVFTEYADWKAGPMGHDGKPCQTCHMPDEKAVLAVGSPVRTGVPHHGLLGVTSDLRRRALGLDVKAERATDPSAGILVTVAVKNNNAGHAVPAGLPERRIAVRVTPRDAAGAAIAATIVTMAGRKLVDGAGREVPFWRATRVDTDSRIGVGGTWTSTATIPAASASVDVDVVYRGLSDAVAEQLGVHDIEEHPMVAAKLKLAGTLPRSTSVVPPPPGKRTVELKQKKQEAP